MTNAASFWLDHEATVSLTAVPQGGAEFLGWFGDLGAIQNGGTATNLTITIKSASAAQFEARFGAGEWTERYDSLMPRLAKRAQDFDVGDYVQSGLVLHFDRSSGNVKNGLKMRPNFKLQNVTRHTMATDWTGPYLNVFYDDLERKMASINNGFTNYVNLVVTYGENEDGIDAAAALPAGEYEVTGSWRVTADETRVNGKRYIPFVQVETWNGSGWAAAGRAPGASYTATDSAKVRLTYTWKRKRGFTLVVR